MSIEVENLIKIYGEQKAVNNISFNINQGEVVGFLGPNGAGKSTTMKIITGCLQQSKGNVSVCGLDVTQLPLAVKKKIGYLPESNPLYHDMYVREYLNFIASIHSIKNKQRAVNKVIEMVGLGSESKKKIGQLSKGYKQRVGLAAALVHDPEVLILDEPTSGLDPNQIIEIRELIKQQGKNKTVLFSSHILQEVESICDRVIIIHKGEIVADDQISNLQKTNKNETIILVQFKELMASHLVESIRDVSSIQPNSDTKISSDRFRIKTSNPESVRKQILELSLQHNCNIVSLQSENNSLEEVFKVLTNK